MLVDPETRKRVMSLLHEGKTLESIERTLSLPKGVAHDVVVDYWYEDKERGKRVKKPRW